MRTPDKGTNYPRGGRGQVAEPTVCDLWLRGPGRSVFLWSHFPGSEARDKVRGKVPVASLAWNPQGGSVCLGVCVLRRFSNAGYQSTTNVVA